MTAILLPPVLRLHDLIEGPEGGWRFDEGHDERLEVSTTSKLVYIEPVASAMLSAWSRFQRQRRLRAITFEALKTRFTRRMGVLSALAGRELALSIAFEGLLPARLIEVEGGEKWTQVFDDELDHLGIPTTSAADAVRHCLEDLVRNVFHHAQTLGGGAHVAASYDPSRGLVRIGVADCGQGVARDIQNHYGAEIPAEQAVLAAVEPRISGSTQPGLNMGVGLYLVRRLALAAKGAMWLRTGDVTLTASSTTPDTFSPKVVSEGAPWQGTAVAATFHVPTIDNFREALRCLIDELEGRGPRFADIQFHKSAEESPSWFRIQIAPDAAKLALDRDRAHSIAVCSIKPKLDDGGRVELDFTNTRTASQSFCYALLSELFAAQGPSLLSRMRFLACSSQVSPMIRMAINEGLRRYDE